MSIRSWPRSAARGAAAPSSPGNETQSAKAQHPSRTVKPSITTAKSSRKATFLSERDAIDILPVQTADGVVLAFANGFHVFGNRPHFQAATSADGDGASNAPEFLGRKSPAYLPETS